jgi:hypothetical protein
MSLKKYRFFCITEDILKYVWGTSEPTECPDDPGHSINTDSITIIEKENLADLPPQELGVASPGVSEDYSRSDHSHAIAKGKSDIDHPFNVETSKTKSGIWAIKHTFMFDGTDRKGIPTEFKVVASVQQPDYPGDVRVYDITNSNQIAILESINNKDRSIFNMGTISNLPTDEAIFSIQLRCLTGNDKYNVNVFSFHMKF